MRDILPEIDRWRQRGQKVALATVIQTWGSAPRRAGSRMAVNANGEFSGSVSGGCVEGAIVEAALEALQTDRPRLLHFGVTDETAWSVGLACGGSIDIFVQPLAESPFESVRAMLLDESAGVLITAIRGPDHLLGRELLIGDDRQVTGTLDNSWNGQLLKLADEVGAAGFPRQVQLTEALEVFAEPIQAPLTLIAVGGVQIAIALVSLAKTLGYRTIVIDPRSAWGNADRFPHVDQMIQSWPEQAFGAVPLTRSTAVAMLTHDPKLDDPALRIALPSQAFYVGALGSRKTQSQRRERLIKAGVREDQLARLHAPIGLQLGADTPEEIALAIMAEIVAAYRRRDQQAELAATGTLHTAI